MIDILIGIVVAILTIVGVAPLFFIINSFFNDLEELETSNEEDNDK